MAEAANVVEAPPTSLKAGNSSAAPPSAGEIHVTSRPVGTNLPPAPGSAKAKIFESLGKIAKVDGQPVAPVAPPAAPAPAAPPAPAPAPTTQQTPPAAEEFDLGEDAEE